MRRSRAIAVAVAALAAALAPHARAVETDLAGGSAGLDPAPVPTNAAEAAPDPVPVPTIAADAAPPLLASPSPPAELAPAAHPRAIPLVGVAVGGGFPELASASLLVRPTPRLRLFAGPCWSSVSFGVQGGVVVSPWSGSVTPTLSLQAGKLFGTDVTRFVRSDSGTMADIKPLLRDVDYQYLAGALGLEVGSPRGLAFYLRLGLSFLAIGARGTATHTASDGTVVTLRDPRVTAWLPSLSLGLQYWF